MHKAVPHIRVGIYRHRKHTAERPKYYLVLLSRVAREADLAPIVLYVRLYPSDKPWFWMRPTENFASNAPGGYGGSTPRFVRVPWRYLFVAVWAWRRGQRSMITTSNRDEA